jgi:peptidoglycan/xylan/chitin deacetylase (PgdA/CDA1 family)
MGRRLVSILPSRVAQAIAVMLLLARRVRSDRAGLVLLYHRIDAVAGCPERELNPAVAASAFAAELIWLRRFYRVLPAREILGAARSRRRWQRYPVAVTLDDDSPTHVRSALPVLRSAGLPSATFFLSGATLDRPAVAWWDRLQEAWDAGLPVGRVLPGEDIHAMGRAMLQLPRAEREAAEAALAEMGADPPPRGLTASDVREIAADQEIGFHTLAHDALTTLPEPELVAALRLGRDRLQAESGQSIDLLAYPHGAAGEREAEAAQVAGFRMGFTTVAASCRPCTDPLRVGRAEAGPVALGRFAIAVERALGRPG